MLQTAHWDNDKLFVYETDKIWDGTILKPGGSNAQLEVITRIT